MGRVCALKGMGDHQIPTSKHKRFLKHMDMFNSVLKERRSTGI